MNATGSRGLLLVVLILAFAVFPASMYATAQSGGLPTTKVLPDGTLELRYPDGTVRLVSKEPSQQKSPEILDDRARWEKTDKAAADPGSFMPVAPVPELLDTATKQKYLAALTAYYDYRLQGYGHRQRVFEWQLFSSKAIFVIVLVLVFSGIYFAAIQFHVGLRMKLSGATSQQEITEVAATIKGIKVSSPVLGVIILTLSLAFFYLYLVYVYPISDVF